MRGVEEPAAFAKSLSVRPYMNPSNPWTLKVANR